MNESQKLNHEVQTYDDTNKGDVEDHKRVESAGIIIFFPHYNFYLKDFLTWPPLFVDPGDVCCMWRPKGKGRSSRPYDDAHSPITIYMDYYVLCTEINHDQGKVPIEQYNN